MDLSGKDACDYAIKYGISTVYKELSKCELS
jgi:hypothetical protein